jgi:hypothetical protein
LLTCPEEAKNVSKRAVQLFWRNHASRRLLRLWQQFSIIQPPQELAVPFSACIACGCVRRSVRGDEGPRSRLPRCREIACARW